MSRRAGSARARFEENLAALERAQKTAQGASLYSRRVNRPLGRRLAAAADLVYLTPNQVTLLSGLFSFAGVALIVSFSPTVPLGIATAGALLFGFALDSADGQLARLRDAGGRAGEWLDHLLDCAVKLSLHAAVLIAWLQSDRGIGSLLLAVCFQFVAVLLFFGGTLAEKLRPDAPESRRPPFHGTPAGHAAELLRVLVDHGTVCLAFLVWGWPAAFSAIYAILFAAHAVLLVAFGIHWYRHLK